MKILTITLSIIFYSGRLVAQNPDTEAEIRGLEQIEVQAILQKDTVTLLKLWDKDYVVNSPNNVIVFAGKTAVDRPVLKNPRTSFTRDIEQIIIRGNTVFSMGSETVSPAGDQDQARQILKRRFTNIWMNQDGVWKLVARHANVICK